jgi:hypothetical protein
LHQDLNINQGLQHPAPSILFTDSSRIIAAAGVLFCNTKSLILSIRENKSAAEVRGLFSFITPHQRK